MVMSLLTPDESQAVVTHSANAQSGTGQTPVSHGQDLVIDHVR